MGSRVVATFVSLVVAGPVLFGAPPETSPVQASPDPVLTAYVLDEHGDLRGVVRRIPDALLAPGAFPDAEARDEALLAAAGAAVLAGPTDEERRSGFLPALPPGTTIDETRVRDDQGGFFVTLPPELVGALTPERAQRLADLFRGLDLAVPRIRRHVFEIRDPRDGRYYPIPHFLPRPAPGEPKPREDRARAGKTTGQPPAQGQGRPVGYLGGKSVFVNPGHGWYYNPSLEGWRTQRGLLYEMIEDHSNAEAVDTYLIHYLWNAGAGVYTCRERDFNDESVVVDDGDPGFTSAGTWALDGASGYGGSCRRAAGSAGEIASATFTPTIPADGYYDVSTWYEGGSANAAGVRYTIRHAGGETVWVQNQKRDGYTWTYVGRFYFRAGASAASGSVTVSNAGAETGFDVVADAVRFGGGTGNETPFGEPAGSGRPRWEEAGPYHARFMGCPSANCGSSTVTAMPQYAKWESEAWEDSIYVSWHSNASSGTARGTSSFAYASGGWDTPFDGVSGSLELRDFVHAELIRDLRAARDPAWPDVGLHTSWFGEINPTYNDEMPGALFEMAFHDNPLDAAELRDPTFRQVAARAVYQGIVRYFADRDGDPSPTFLPEPPTNLRLVNDGTGAVAIAWDAPPYDTGDGLLGDAATGYRVYRSLDGLGFDDGVDVPGGASTGSIDSAVETGATYFYRVTATNPGGESFPTETLTVRVTRGLPRILLVAGFDRMDEYLGVAEVDPQSGGVVRRGYVDRMNSYRYAATYGRAIDSYGVPFDSCSNEAVIDGQVSLGQYDSVLWFCGEEGTEDHTFDPTEQALAQSFFDGGGSLLVSGTDLGWDLDFRGNGAAFYHDVLKATYVRDDAGTYAVQPAATGIFAGEAPFSFDDGTYGEYDADYPDVLLDSGGSQACLFYEGVAEGYAGIQFDDGIHRVVHLGFPLETVTSAATRDALVARVLDFFGETPPPPVPDGTFGAPMTARALSPAAESIELTWDAEPCPAPGYHLVYGELETVADYAVVGGICGLSTSGSDVWNGVPPGNLWFLLLPDDGSNVEGPWGIQSRGTRHDGRPSDTCGMVDRNESGVCGPAFP